MLLYKFFFFNYLFQVTGGELVDSLLSSEPSLYEMYAKDLHEAEPGDDTDQEVGEQAE